MSDALTHLNRAIRAHATGSLEEAKYFYKKTLIEDPQNASALGWLGSIEAQHKNYDVAKDLLLKALAQEKNNKDFLLNYANLLFEKRQFFDAVKYYQKAIRQQPNDPISFANLAACYNEQSQPLLGLGVADQSIQLKPDYAEAWNNRGNALHDLKRYEEAITDYDKALNLKPDHHQAWIDKGVTLHELKRFDDAITHYDKALSLKPDHHQAWTDKGVTLHELKRYEEAITHYDKALSLKPDHHHTWSNKGNTLHELKRLDEAIAHHDKALSLKPDNAKAWSNKGVTLHELKRLDEAIAHYDKALSLKPDYAEAWSNKGVTLHELKRLDEAIAHYDKALSLKSDYAEAWSNKAVVLNELKRYNEAIAHYDKALSLKPDYAEAWSNKAVVLNELKRYDEAINHFDKALSLKSDIDWVSGYLLHTKMKICSWSGLVDSLEIISQKVMANEKVATPFPLLALNDDTFLHKKSSEIYIQSRYPFNPILEPISKRPRNQKIRIGYFSSDFHNHAVSRLTVELYELHDKNKFEIIAFSFGVDDRSPMRSRLQQAFNQFIDVSDMSDLKIAKLARVLGIDIAVDLGGFTAGSRTGIFSYRAAPVQLNYIGYLGTMGAEYYDYLLADKTIIPENIQKIYSEKIIYLASYQVNDRKRTISERQFTRHELGLPEDEFVFCCFNNNYKILPSTFNCWMRILNAVEGSVLFLYADNERAKANLIDEAILRGVDSARLVFGELILTEEYLARYRVCDLFLDTFPYNAGTTASDALWTGLPLLTLMGSSFASRVAASLLNAIGLAELITSTQEDYEALAIELATNPHKLADIKLKLANNRMTTPLFDTPLFTKNLEAAYIRMYEESQVGL